MYLLILLFKKKIKERNQKINVMSTAVIKKTFFKRKTPKATCDSQKYSFNQVHFFLFMITSNDYEMFGIFPKFLQVINGHKTCFDF